MAKAPGSYSKVVDGSTRRRASGDMRVGIVGGADWGPVNVPTQVASPGDCNALFGGEYHGIYACLNNLQNTPNVYYTRVTQGTPVKALVTITDNTPTTPDEVCIATALYFGTTGNYVSVERRPASNGSAVHVDFYIKFQDNVISIHRNLGALADVYAISSPYVVFTAVGTPPTWADLLWDTTVEFDLVSGSSGGAITATDCIGAKGTSGGTADTGLYTFSTPEWRKLDLLFVPGFSEDTMVNALTEIITYYHNKLIMVMLDPPSSVVTRQTLLDWINGDGALSTKLDNYNYFVSCPWHNMLKSDGTEYAVTPSSVASAVWAGSIKTAIYKAPAGPKRGRWPYSASLAVEFDKTDIALMYSEPGECLNVFYNDPDRGIVLTGQKTAYRAESDLNKVKTVFNLNRMIKELDFLADGETFEDNNEDLWTILNTYAEMVMGGRASAGLLHAYEFLCNADTNTVDGRLTEVCYAEVRVQITPTSEWIDITWTLSSAGTTF